MKIGCLSPSLYHLYVLLLAHALLEISALGFLEAGASA
jgi:hypothetical protein